MRMERLLADLEAAHEAETRAESRAEVAESVRAEQAAVTVTDRLRGAVGRVVTLSVADESLHGRLVDVGEGWLATDRGFGELPQGVADLVRPGVRLVPIEALAGVAGLGRTHVASSGSTIGRGWSSVLRTVARSRVPIAWHARGAETSVGTVEAVGADHVMLSPHRSADVRLLPLQALLWIDVCASTR